MNAPAEWEVVARLGSLDAEVMKAALETADIPVQLLYETVGRIYALDNMQLGEVKVLVPPDRADEARELLATAQPIDFPAGD